MMSVYRMRYCCALLLGLISVGAVGCAHVERSEQVNMEAKPDPAADMPDPAVAMIAQVDQAPAEQRPPNWEFTKSLMKRRAPAVGESAPDFTLSSVDGKTTITRSKFQAKKPLVLIFGSFT